MRNSNSSLKSASKRINLTDVVLIVLGAFLLAPSANAIDPDKAISQYFRDYWNTSNGFPGGRVNSIVQTPDGYLWIGTDNGLVSYDGINFRPFRNSEPSMQPISGVLQLVVDRVGDLWVRDQTLNTVRIHDGHSEDVLASLGEAESNVSAMFGTANGSVLLSVMRHGVYRYRNGKIETLATPSALSTGLVSAIAETSRGKVWMGTRDEGLLYIDRGQINSIKDKLPDTKINCLLSGDNGSFWIGTGNGLAFSDGEAIKSVKLPPTLNNVPVLSLLRDRNSNLWIGTEIGLFRLNASGVTAQDRKKDRSGVAVTALFEDREGNLWVGDAQGIERLRDSSFSTYSEEEGLPSETNGSIFADSSDRLWVASSNGGLYRIEKGKVEQIQNVTLGKHIVYSITGNKDEIWLGLRAGGLMHLFSRNGALRTETYTQANGLTQNSVSSVYRSRDGTIWTGSLNGGVSQLKDGKLVTYTTANGLGANSIASIEQGIDGAMWFATSGGLTRLSKGHWQTFTTQQGLPSDQVTALLQDPKGILWIGTMEGLAYMTSNEIECASDAQGPLSEPILGMALDRIGSIWIATSNRVLRMNRRAALNRRLNSQDIQEYDAADGLRGTEGVRRDRTVVEDSRGRIWLSTNRGVSLVDPSHITRTLASPIAHVKSIAADGIPLSIEGQIKIPASRRIAIGYLGLSLSSPERVQYRYKLEEFDHSWSEPVSKREVEYTNLNPGLYHFKVEAANRDDLAKSTEASLVFRIEPAFWLTWWFQVSCALTIALVSFLFYLLRLRQIAWQLNMRFEERLSERMRISRELQDTLLQGFLNASVQLRAADDTLADNSPAKQLLGRVLELVGQVTDEGRKALQGLSPHPIEPRDLVRAFSSVPGELALEQEAAYRIVVNGLARPLLPAVHDEVYLIGREAVVNAFRHSNATHIEVEMDYTSSHLQMVVRDDGCGIHPNVVDSGREGHWGLPGMRERAKGIGAKLRVWSRESLGTEVEFTISGRLAYCEASGISPLRRLRTRLSSRATSTKDGDSQ